MSSAPSCSPARAKRPVARSRAARYLAGGASSGDRLRPAALLVAERWRGGCGSERARRRSGQRAGDRPVTIAGRGHQRPRTRRAQEVEPATDPGSVDAAPRPSRRRRRPARALQTRHDAFPAIWVRAGHEVEMRTEPGGGELVARVGRRTEFGSPSVFSVVEQSRPLGRGEHADARRTAPSAGSGSTRSASTPAGPATQIVVDLSERRAELMADGEAKLQLPGHGWRARPRRRRPAASRSPTRSPACAQPRLRLLRAGALRHPAEPARRAGSAATGSRSTAPRARSARRSRTGACAPPTPMSVA